LKIFASFFENSERGLVVSVLTFATSGSVKTTFQCEFEIGINDKNPNYQIKAHVNTKANFLG